MRRCTLWAPKIKAMHANNLNDIEIKSVKSLAYVDYGRDKILVVNDGFICDRKDFSYTNYDVILSLSDEKSEYIVIAQEHEGNVQGLDDTPRVFKNQDEAEEHAKFLAKKYSCAIRSYDSDIPAGITQEGRKRLMDYREKHNNQLKGLTDKQALNLAFDRLSNNNQSPDGFIDSDDRWQFKEAVRERLDIIFNKKRYLINLLKSNFFGIFLLLVLLFFIGDAMIAALSRFQ